jgi:predicted ATPase
VEAVVALLARRDVRLVTLTGGGGIGKTRLALEVARTAAPRFPDGAFFVPLASLADPALVLPAIARAIGLTEGGGVRLEEALAARLAHGDWLVLLDNLEHLLEGVGSLGALVAAAPGLTLLAMSRRPLRLYGEHRFAVPPLAPEAAEQLFVDRARAAGALVGADDPVGLLCRRLDGHPTPVVTMMVMRLVGGVQPPG